MDEMKSALEKALERAERMGKLSPEEMQRQNKAKYVPIGEAIAQRFFEHGYSSILAEQLDKLEPEGKAIATRAAILTLIDTINMENKDLTARILEGVISLCGQSVAENIANEIMSLFGKYEWQKKLWYEENAEEMEKPAREKLSETGISGSAIAEINMENNEEWAKKIQEIRAEFESNLSELKKTLTEKVA